MSSLYVESTLLMASKSYFRVSSTKGSIVLKRRSRTYSFTKGQSCELIFKDTEFWLILITAVYFLERQYLFEHSVDPLRSFLIRKENPRREFLDTHPGLQHSLDLTDLKEGIWKGKKRKSWQIKRTNTKGGNWTCSLVSAASLAAVNLFLFSFFHWSRRTLLN